jgi:hypothetical protein
LRAFVRAAAVSFHTMSRGNGEDIDVIESEFYEDTFRCALKPGELRVTLK